MRVVSGIFKGRKLDGYKILGTRPTMDRIKESLFAMIQMKIKDAYVLDLFAGSGSYGIEALSLGAKFVYFNDKNWECVKVINKNLTNLGILKNTIVASNDYLKCLKILKKEQFKFDCVFLDPPYKLLVVDKIMQELDQSLLNMGSYVIFEVEKEISDSYENFKLLKQKQYGNKRIYIYEYKGEKNEIE